MAGSAFTTGNRTPYEVLCGRPDNCGTRAAVYPKITG